MNYGKLKMFSKIIVMIYTLPALLRNAKTTRHDALLLPLLYEK
jgi:hypothetical protein